MGRAQTLRKGVANMKSKKAQTIMKPRFYRVERALGQTLTGQ